MAIVKQTITYMFEDPITIESDLFSGSNRNVSFIPNQIKTSIEMAPGVGLQRPPRVDDVSPIVIGNKWEGLEITFDRKGLIQGGGFVKPQKVKEIVESELEVQGFDEIEIADTSISVTR